MENIMSIKIRKAVQEDAPFLAQMILQSSRAGKRKGVFDFLFHSCDEDKVLHSLQLLTQTQAKSYCHFSNFLVAESDGKKVGTLCSYEPRISTKEIFIKALNEIGYDDAEENLKPLYECDFELNKRTIMFDFMEELEGFIDVGVLKALMQKSLLTARLKGYRIAQSIVEMGSLDMIMYYKKLGFKEVEQKECEAYKERFGRAGFILFSIEF
jgi:N-acetylglutamate synthase-like GNAT family acetyltransferase